VDVATEAGVAELERTIGAARVRALVHAAGREGLLRLAETDRTAFDALVATNLAAPFFVTRALLGSFGAGASVVFVGSVAAVRGRDRHAAYAAAKAGLLGLTVNLAAELAPSVRVNCICVGATRTPMFEQAVREYVGATGVGEIPAADRGRLLLGVAEPEQIAASIAYLALDASFSTGTVLYADGGYTAR
jgi:NAD(P)-dependent dehydrogenase (short-subunit alcohol dehydrogenase family)